MAQILLRLHVRTPYTLLVTKLGLQGTTWPSLAKIHRQRQVGHLVAPGLTATLIRDDWANSDPLHTGVASHNVPGADAETAGEWEVISRRTLPNTEEPEAAARPLNSLTHALPSARTTARISRT